MSWWHDPEACEAGRAIGSLGANASRIIAGLGDGISPDEASQVLDGCWDMIFQVADALGDAAWASEDGETADGLTGAQQVLYAALKEMDRYVHALEARAEAVRLREGARCPRAGACPRPGRSWGTAWPPPSWRPRTRSA